MKYKITLNNKTYEVEVEKGEAILTAEYEAYAPQAKASEAPAAAKEAVKEEKAPAASESSNDLAAGEQIKAPLPGTVVEVKVKAGDSVKKGDALLVIEAMKMGNDIMAPKDGKVTGVYAVKGQSVERGFVLVTVE